MQIISFNGGKNKHDHSLEKITLNSLINLGLKQLFQLIV